MRAFRMRRASGLVVGSATGVGARAGSTGIRASSTCVTRTGTRLAGISRATTAMLRRRVTITIARIAIPRLLRATMSARNSGTISLLRGPRFLRDRGTTDTRRAYPIGVLRTGMEGVLPPRRFGMSPGTIRHRRFLGPLPAPLLNLALRRRETSSLRTKMKVRSRRHAAGTTIPETTAIPDRTAVHRVAGLVR